MKSTKHICLGQIITLSLKLTFKEPSDLGLTTLLWEIITKLRLIQLWIKLRLKSKVKFRSSHGKLSVIRQKGEFQNGCFKKTKHAKFSEKLTYFTPWYAHVRTWYVCDTCMCGTWYEAGGSIEKIDSVIVKICNKFHGNFNNIYKVKQNC